MLVLELAGPVAASSVDSAALTHRQVVLLVECCYCRVEDLTCDVGSASCLALRVIAMLFQPFEGWFGADLDSKTVSVLESGGSVQVVMC